jgi:hypothetical protein
MFEDIQGVVDFFFALLWLLAIGFALAMLCCHIQFLCQNQVFIVCMMQDQLFHTYDQKCSQITKCQG